MGKDGKETKTKQQTIKKTKRPRLFKPDTTRKLLDKNTNRLLKNSAQIFRSSAENNQSYQLGELSPNPNRYSSNTMNHPDVLKNIPFDLCGQVVSDWTIKSPLTFKKSLSSLDELDNKIKCLIQKYDELLVKYERITLYNNTLYNDSLYNKSNVLAICDKQNHDRHQILDFTIDKYYNVIYHTLLPEKISEKTFQRNNVTNGKPYTQNN